MNKENQPADIDDGFGTSAPAICLICGLQSVYVNRPGDIRCGVCYDHNPKDWYTGEHCLECGYMAIHNGRCLCCSSEPADNERIYPCDKCGKLRTKAEGGTTFTLCDDCWDKHYKKPHPPSRLLTDEEITELCFQHDTVLRKTERNKRLWFESVEKHRKESTDYLLEAQDAKTRKETLKEVGELIEQKTLWTLVHIISKGNISARSFYAEDYEEFLDNLKAGELK